MKTYPLILLTGTEIAAMRGKKLFGGPNNFAIEHCLRADHALLFVENLIRRGGLSLIPPAIVVVGDGWYADFNTEVLPLISTLRRMMPACIIALWTKLPCDDRTSLSKLSSFGEAAIRAGADLTEENYSELERSLPERISSLIPVPA